MEKVLLMIIGIPGSGKTTKAQNIQRSDPEFKDANIWEADMYFIDPITKEYVWNKDELWHAHKWCQRNVEEDMKKGKNVIVSNTSLTESERRPYIQLAKEYGYKVEVITCTGNYKNIHNVPDESIARMRLKFQPFNEETELLSFYSKIISN